MTLSPPQIEVIRRYVEGIGMMIMLWRRQGGKTTDIANLALYRMAERRRHLFTFASASLLVGREVIYREAAVLQGALDKMQADVKQRGMLLEVGERNHFHADRFSVDDFADIFSRSALEMRLYHDRTSYSRTQVIAPNPATARSYSGDVAIDEIQSIAQMKELYDAMEPIASRDPDFRILMSMTPPFDDGHFSFELILPPEGTEFPLDGKGNFYVSQAGILCHRLSVYDAELSGVYLYDGNTRQRITPQQHRERAVDKAAWDRNYGLVLRRGGAAACSIMGIHEAQLQGAGKCIARELDFPE